MKKFLLVLSCFLATWCSVQAGLKCSTSDSELYGMSQSASMLMASAPAAAPAPEYPAKINSATHKPEEGVIEVKFTVKTAGNVAFSLDDGKTKAWSQYCSEGGHKANVPFKTVSTGGVIPVLISVGGHTCGGTAVKIIPPVKPVAYIDNISYVLKNKTVKVEYSIYNPNSVPCFVTVRKNGSTGSQIFKQEVSKGSTMLEIPSSKFAKKKVYYVEISCGDDAKSGEKYIFDDVRSGYMGNVSVDDQDCTVTFDYYLKNAGEPYIAIKEGSKYGPVVKTYKVDNTNGVYKDVTFNYNVLKRGTNYVADLFDGSEDLRIFSEEFRIPELNMVTEEEYDFEWHPVSNTQFVIIPSKKISPYVDNLRVRVYKLDPVKGSFSYEYSAEGDPKKDYYVNVQINTNFYYKIELVWSNGKRKEKKILYNTKY